MSGPIVRSGASPAFSQNWDSIFGKKSGGSKVGAAKKSAKKAKPAPKKKAAKKKKS